MSDYKSEKRMALSGEDTHIQLQTIAKQLERLKMHATGSAQDIAVPLINAAVNAVHSFDNDIPIPIQQVLNYLAELNNVLKDEESKAIISTLRPECVAMLVGMFVRNQHKIDTLSGSIEKLKEKYRNDFLQSKHQLAENFHQHKEATNARPPTSLPKVSSYLNTIFQFLDFREPFRKAEFINALHAQTIKYYRQSQIAETSYKYANLSELMQLEIAQRLIHTTLMNEANFDIGMLPTKSRSYQFFMKELVGRYQGIVIGNLAIAENSYEASREWLTKINKFMNQPWQTYQFINEMDHYTANQQRRFAISKPANKTQAMQDSLATPDVFKRLKTFDHSFVSNFLDLLDKSYPSSALLKLSDNKGASHTVAIAKDKRGIWLHDANRYCVYFPNKELGSKEAAEHFAHFFVDYHQRNYRHMNKVDLVHFPEQAPAPKNTVSQEPKQQREQPLILGPGPANHLNKSFGRDLSETKVSPQSQPSSKNSPTNRGPKSGF